MAVGVTSPVLVGREAEAALLSQALERATRGASIVALLGGEAGVGKSRLVGELADAAHQHGVLVCTGRCVDLGPGPWSLAPWREIVAGLAAELNQEALDLIVGRAREVFASLVPELGGAAIPREPIAPEQLCQLLVASFRRLTARGPVVIVVEDLHWADTTSLMAFSALARTERIGPLLLVGTFRNDEVHGRHPLLPAVAEIGRTGRCVRVDLRPFDQSTTVSLTRTMEGVPDGLDAVDIHRRSGGNAFFIEELVAASAAGLAGFPDTLRDVILARTASLDDALLELLAVAGVAGATLPAVLADGCGRSEEAVRAMLRELYPLGLLAPDGDEVRFRHELGREVFAAELPPSERPLLHARLARSLTRHRPRRLGEIARHWSAAGDQAQALASSMAAGRAALRIGAAADAEVHFDRALGLWDSVDGAAELSSVDHAGVLAETALAAEHAGHIDRAIELLRRATLELAGVDPLREAAAWLNLRDLYRFLNRWDLCVEVVTRALALIPESPPTGIRAEALAHAALNQIIAQRADEALALTRDAIAVAEAAGDEAMTIKAYDVLVPALDLYGDPHGALAVALDNLRRCRPGLPPECIVGAHNAVIGQLGELDRQSEIPRYAEQVVELARSTGLAGARAKWNALAWIESLVLLGRWQDAELLVADLDDLLSHPTLPGDLAGCWGMVLLRQGRLDEARPLVEKARTVLAQGSWSVDPFVATPVIELDAIDHREGVEETTERVLNCKEAGRGAHHLMVSAAIRICADRLTTADLSPESSVAQAAVARATSWIERADDIEQLDRNGPPSRRLHREQAVAELALLAGRNDPGSWSRLADGWATLGYAYDEAYTRFRHGDALLAGTSGRTTRARHDATAALQTASTITQRLAARPLALRIDDLAVRARLPLQPTSDRPPKPPRSDARAVPGLTQREQSVLALLAEGYSNGQIAQALFISTKTASVHVSNILRKLNVSNRVEAAAKAQRSPPS